MAGTVTMGAVVAAANGGIRIPLNWTSHTDGTVSAAPVTISSVGKFTEVIVVPGTGDDAPTTYGLIVKDAFGIDMLGGAGTSRSATDPARFQLDPTVDHYGGAITLEITSAGSAKKGTVSLVLE